jgi:RNA polymerase sigma-70 factor (ECF subfamily)
MCTEAGLAVVHREHHEVLLGRARYLVGDPALAEDVVQEVLVRAWRACPTFDPDGEPLRHWLMTVLRNIVIDQARARARRPQVVAPLPGDPAAATGDETASVLLWVDLTAALGRISDAHRDAVVATIIRDRTYAEAAAELRIPVGTVKSRVHHGLRHLRSLLETVPGPALPAALPAAA